MTQDRPARLSTGIEGLDYVLRGGFPPGHLYLVQGHPGVGKTTLALQFLLEGVQRGEPGLYITLSESRKELEEIARSHGWSLDQLTLFELTALQKSQAAEDQSILDPSEVELGEAMAPLLAEVERTNPVRVVFDSLSEIRLLAQHALRYRRQILALKQYFAGRKSTVLLLDDLTSPDQDLQLQSLAHGVVALESSQPEYGAARRRVFIQKLRGVQFRSGKHDYDIVPGGVRVYPRLVAAEESRNPNREILSCGLPKLDLLLGGGLRNGKSLLVTGPSGSGKSLLATQFAMQAAKRGDASVIFEFDENADTFLERSAGVGMDLQKHVKSGLISLQQIDPAELTPGEFAFRVRFAIEKQQARLVIIDSLTGYLQAMIDQRHLTLHLHELLSYLAQRGIITIATVAQSGMMGETMANSAELSFLADQVVTLRFFECFGEIRQAISVPKNRTSAQERSIREFRIGKGGFQIGEPLKEFQGVLRGVPTYSGKASKLLQKKKRKP